MKTLVKTLADEFGLSQQQIADYFGIHFSIVSRMRSGSRNLPAKAIQQGSQMLQAIQQLKKRKRAAINGSPHDLPNRLLLVREEIIDCQLQIKQLQDRLIKLKLQKQQCEKSAALLQYMQELSNNCSGEKQKRWLAETKYNNALSIKKCDAEQQWSIEIKLKGLEVQLAFYEKQQTVIKNQINKS